MFFLLWDYVDHQKTRVESLWQKIFWSLYKVLLYIKVEKVSELESASSYKFLMKSTHGSSLPPISLIPCMPPPAPNFLCPLSRPFYPQSTQSTQNATAALWHTFQHEVKIGPGWWVGGGGGVHAHPLSIHLPSLVKLQCTLQLSGQIY